MPPSRQPVDVPVLSSLVAREHPPCPACRRELHDLRAPNAGRGPRCPHCGVELACSLDARGAGGTAWLLGMLAASLGGGFHVLTAPMVVRSIASGVFLPMPLGAIWIGGLVVNVGLVLAWLLGRHRIRRWPRWVTLGAATVTLLLVLAGIALLAMT